MSLFSYIFISFVFVFSECRNVNYMEENSSFEDIVSGGASSGQGQIIFMNKLKKYVESDSENESIRRTVNRGDLSEHVKSEHFGSENSSFEDAAKGHGQLVFVDKLKEFSKSEIEHETKSEGRMVFKDDLGELAKSEYFDSENSLMEREKDFMDLLLEDVIGIEMHSNEPNYSLLDRPNIVPIGDYSSFEDISVYPEEYDSVIAYNNDYDFPKGISISSGELDNSARTENIFSKGMDVLEVIENRTQINSNGVISFSKESQRPSEHVSVSSSDLNIAARNEKGIGYLGVTKNPTKAEATGVIIFPGASQGPVEDVNRSPEVNVSKVDLSNRQSFDVPVLCKEGYGKDMFGECVEIFE